MSDSENSNKDLIRTNYFTKSPWEPLRGYSRAVRFGNQLFIAGTTAMAEGGQVIGVGDAYQQTKFIFNLIKQILNQAGFQINDVVRTRLFVTSIADWDKYARAHRETFEQIRPASSIVQVSKLVDPRLLLEVEVDAILGAKQVETQQIKYREEDFNKS